jgi:hypothetical protein
VSRVSYMLDGKQYLSMLSGPTLGSRLYTFVLDGKEPIPAAPKTTTSVAGTAPPQQTRRPWSGVSARHVMLWRSSLTAKWIARVGKERSTTW